MASATQIGGVGSSVPLFLYWMNYSFDNGIATAKKDGLYGAIDLNNNIVIPFNLPYDEVRGVRNGRASVMDCNGKWGHSRHERGVDCHL